MATDKRLVACDESDLRLEPGASASADGPAEDAGVDEEPHDSIAAANALSSSSDSSSISKASIEASTGAASSVVLPHEDLDAMERHTIGVSSNAGALPRVVT